MAKAAGKAEATTVASQASKTTAAEVTQAAATQGEKTAATQAAQAVGKPATAVVLTEAEIAAVAADVEAQVAAEAAAARNQAATQATKAPPTQPATPATQAPKTPVQPAAKHATQPAATQPATPPTAKPTTKVPQQAAEATTEAELAAATVVAAEEKAIEIVITNVGGKQVRYTILTHQILNKNHDTYFHIFVSAIDKARWIRHAWGQLGGTAKEIAQKLIDMVKQGIKEGKIPLKGPFKLVQTINGITIEVRCYVDQEIIEFSTAYVQTHVKKIF